MTLLTRVLAEKRAFLTVVAMILAVDVGVYALVVYPWSNRVSGVETRTAAAEAQLDQLRAAHAAATELSENKSYSDGELQRFYTEVLPADLAGARTISSPLLAELAEASNLVLERRSQAADKERGSPLTRLRTTMVLAGDYEDIREFIYELETAPEFLLIEAVVLSQGDESDDALVLTLGVSTYFWAGPDAES